MACASVVNELLLATTTFDRNKVSAVDQANQLRSKIDGIYKSAFAGSLFTIMWTIASPVISQIVSYTFVFLTVIMILQFIRILRTIHDLAEGESDPNHFLAALKGKKNAIWFNRVIVTAIGFLTITPILKWHDQTASWLYFIISAKLLTIPDSIIIFYGNIFQYMDTVLASILSHLNIRFMIIDIHVSQQIWPMLLASLMVIIYLLFFVWDIHIVYRVNSYMKISHQIECLKAANVFFGVPNDSSASINYFTSPRFFERCIGLLVCLLSLLCYSFGAYNSVALLISALTIMFYVFYYKFAHNGFA